MRVRGMLDATSEPGAGKIEGQRVPLHHHCRGAVTATQSGLACCARLVAAPEYLGKDSTCCNWYRKYRYKALQICTAPYCAGFALKALGQVCAR